MALSRLLLVICALIALTSESLYAQPEPTNANQDGIMIMDALGRFFSASEENNIGAYLFEELLDTSQSMGFPFAVAKDLEFVARPDGTPRGAYVLDDFGGQHVLNIPNGEDDEPIPGAHEFGQFNEEFSIPPYFGFDVAEDLEIAPDWRDVTNGFKGYFVLDADGVVHPVGETNLPKYAYFEPNAPTDNIEDATFISILFPETINTSGSTITPEALLQNGPLMIPVNRPYTSNQIIESVTPIFTYFGLGTDIARDLEVSAEFVSITIPSRTDTGPIDSRPFTPRTIAMTNGYYIMDGLGAVHSSRLPLDFDVNNDGQVLYDDLYSDLDNEEINEDFGNPINNTVIAPNWIRDREDLPYFGSDFAVDFEMTPSGRGFYLLDAFGGVFAVGDAHFLFPPDAEGNRTRSTTPYFGFPIARGLTLVPNVANPSLGLQENQVVVGMLVLDGLGGVHEAGLATSYNISETIAGGDPFTVYSDIFRDIEITPVWQPRSAEVRNFVVNDEIFSVNVAPEFRNVTAVYSTVSSPQ